jgi:hypothetical protein
VSTVVNQIFAMFENNVIQLYKRLLLVILLALALLALPLRWLTAQPLAGIPSANAQETQVVDIHTAFNVLDPMNCFLVITTLDTLPPHQSFATALPLTNYQNLALASGNQFSQVQAHDDYYFVNPKPGTFYDVEALPQSPGCNYNLGMVIYDHNYQPIVTDANPLDNCAAQVRWVADNDLPYYAVVSQVAYFCSGGYYNLIVSTAGYWLYLPALVKDYSE